MSDLLSPLVVVGFQAYQQLTQLEAKAAERNALVQEQIWEVGGQRMFVDMSQV